MQVSGKRKVCYIKKTDPDYDRMIIQQNISRPKGFMVSGGVLRKKKQHFVLLHLVQKLIRIIILTRF
jgi:hypothetical protein